MINHLIDYDLKDFFSRIKDTKEDFGIFELNKSDLEYYNLDVFKKHVINFFSYGIYQDPCVKINSPEDYKTQTVIDWAKNIETYCKYVWLTREYLNHSKFDNLMGAHWNPSTNKWCVHPGLSRKLVYYLFGPEQSEFIGFNTNKKAKKINLKKKYSSVEDFDKDFSNYIFSFTSDYQTIIPHVHFNTHDYILENVIQYHKKMKDFYLNTKIIANFDLKKWNLPVPNKNKNTVKITLNLVNDENQLKAFMLMPSFKKFNNYGVKIEYI